MAPLPRVETGRAAPHPRGGHEAAQLLPVWRLGDGLRVLLGAAAARALRDRRLRRRTAPADHSDCVPQSVLEGRRSSRTVLEPRVHVVRRHYHRRGAVFRFKTLAAHGVVRARARDMSHDSAAGGVRRFERCKSESPRGRGFTGRAVQHLGRGLCGDDGVAGDCLVDPGLGRLGRRRPRGPRDALRVFYDLRGQAPPRDHQTLLARLGHDDLSLGHHVHRLAPVRPLLGASSSGLAFGLLGARRRGSGSGLHLRGRRRVRAPRRRRVFETAGFFVRVVAESCCVIAFVCMYFPLPTSGFFSDLP
mmetsp:Transcript_4482/g.11214  ORF Transcript_4482/g.11214 Transcript_4482/m.11214 type:complete len:304 (+) Transcript_4482:494-1405(+)